MHRSVPLVGRRFLIGRRCCLRRFLQVRDVGKVVLLGHTDGQSQDHHLPFAGSRRDKERKTGQRWDRETEKSSGKGRERTIGHGGGRGAEGTEEEREVTSGADWKHQRLEAGIKGSTQGRILAWILAGKARLGTKALI